LTGIGPSGTAEKSFRSGMSVIIVLPLPCNFFRHLPQILLLAVRRVS
jgi:hypothetical protein